MTQSQTQAYSWGYPTEWTDVALRKAVYDFLQTNPVETKEIQGLRKQLGEWKPPLTFGDLKQGEKFQLCHVFTHVIRHDMMKIQPIRNIIDYNVVNLITGVTAHLDDAVKVVRL